MNISTAKGNADYEWAIHLNRFSLDAVGLWPAEYRGRKRFFATLRAVVFFLLVTLFFTVPCLLLLIMNRDDLTEFIDNLGFVVSLILTELKFVIVYKHKKNLLPIISMMAADWAKSKTHSERTVMLRRARVGRAIGVFLYTLLIISLGLMFILPRFGIMMRYIGNGTDARRSFPFPVYYMHNAYESPYYEIFLFIQFIITFTLFFTYSGIDHFLTILIFHVCGQLENLRARLANIKKSEQFDHVVVAVVEDHIRLLRAVNVIENTFSFLLLAMLVHFVIFACIYGLTLLSMLNDMTHNSMVRTLFLTISVTVTFLQSFFYCFAGQILTTQSEGLYDAIYECDWLSLNSREAQSLIMIMARTMSPLYITAGQLFPMTMLTFCNILKVSLSYISFLVARL